MPIYMRHAIDVKPFVRALTYCSGARDFIYPLPLMCSTSSPTRLSP